MFNKKFINIIFVTIVLTTLTSCAYISSLTKGKSTKIEEKGRAAILNTDNKINNNTSEKLDTIAGLAFGTDYALSKVPTPQKEVQVARGINQRVVSIAGSPTVEKMKDMQDTIDKLTSTLANEREIGIKKLNDKDSSIIALQDESKILISEKEAQIHKYMLTAQTAAEQSDLVQGELNKMNKWFGLGAIWYGVKRFAISAMWILGIGSILFFVLRIASMSNPICASIFQIFNVAGSWVVNTIKVIVPKAVELSGSISNNIFNAYKNTLVKVIDGIQIVRDRAIAAGKEPNLEDVLNEVEKTMNSDEKAIIDELKKSLNWK